MYIPVASELASLLRFHYVIPHEANSLNEASPFQAFFPGVLSTHHLFRTAALAPRDVIELISDRREIIGQRLVDGTHRSVPIHVDALQDLLSRLEAQLCVILSARDEIAREVNRVASGSVWPILHVTPDGRYGDVALPDLTRACLVEYTLRFAEAAEQTGHHSMAGQLKAELGEWEDRVTEGVVPLTHVNHLIASPNQILLRSLGLKFRDEDQGRFNSPDNKKYWDMQRGLVEEILKLREDLYEISPGLRPYTTHDMILVAPSILKHWKSLKGKFRELAPASKKHVATAVKYMRSSETFAMQVLAEDAPQFTSDPAVKAVVGARRAELEAMTSAVSMRASSTGTPVIRLPTGVNGVRGKLERLAGSIRSKGGGDAMKLSRIARNMSEELAAGLPQWLMERLGQATRVKLYSDMPLEWLDVGGLPLMLRADVSRTALSPGNLFFGETVAPSVRFLSRQDFDEILVVRSFEEHDKVRPILEVALKTMEPALRDAWPKVRLVDVRDREEFVAALEAFNGAVMIFDGHGMQLKGSDVGVLRLAKEDVDPWTLREEVTVPPICILSACDTHAWDASHATSANGFLTAGAVTVWATGVPIPAKEAAILVARLVLRMSHLIPLLLRRDAPAFRWSEIPPGLQRRQYVTEALIAARSYGLPVSEDSLIRISQAVGMHIESHDNQWHERFLERLASETRRSLADVAQVIRRTAYFCHALSYTQYGNPETLLCVSRPTTHEASDMHA